MLAEMPGVTDETIAALTKYYGLNAPFMDRYFTWLWAILHGNFGTSIIYNQPVGDLLQIWGGETPEDPGARHPARPRGWQPSPGWSHRCGSMAGRISPSCPGPCWATRCRAS